MEYANKISTKNFVEDKAIARQKPMLWGKLLGVADSYKVTESQYGESIGFKGSFEYQSYSSGEVTRAGILYAPAVLTNLLEPQMKREGVFGVQFAVEIGTKPSDKTVGYEYTIKPLVTMEEADPLQAVRVRLPKPEEKQEKHKK